MSLNRWQQIEEIFQATFDLPLLERSDYFPARCRNGTELNYEVEKLLADFDSAEDFIESPFWTDSELLNSAAKQKIASSFEEAIPAGTIVENDAMIGKRIGVFELKK